MSGYLWVMTAVMLVAGPGALAAAWIIGRGHRQPPLPDDPNEHARAALRSARLRVLASGGVAIAVIALASAAIAPFAAVALIIVPCVAMAIGLLVYAIYPARNTASGPRRSALLDPRHPLDTLKKSSVAGWFACAALTVFAVIVCGLTSSRDLMGRYLSFERDYLLDGVIKTVSHGPYPGWHLGIPLLIGSGFLAAATWWAIRRVSELPALPGVGLEAADRRWRSESADIVLQLSSGTLLIQCGAMVYLALGAIFDANSEIIQTTSDTSDVGRMFGPSFELNLIAFLALGTIAFVVFGSGLLRAVRLPRDAMSAKPGAPK